MFKKIVFYFSMLLLLFSCAGQIAKSQFERGEYRESVKTSLSLLENGKYSNLKLEEKQEILNRMKIIDNFYANAENNPNISTMYDAFAIGYMINTKVPELSQQMVNLNKNTVDRLANTLEYKITSNLANGYEKNEVDSMEAIRCDMKEIRIPYSKYANMYKNISKAIADKYYKLAENTTSIQKAIDYYKSCYIAYSDFYSDYRGAKTKYKELQRELDIQMANKLYEVAKSYYSMNDYNTALMKFKEARALYNKYYEYNSRIRDIDVYIENLNNRIKENKAEEYFQKACIYQAKGDYMMAAKYFYEAHNMINNYKGSYDLAKRMENNLNYYNYKSKTYKLYAEKFSRESLIERLLFSKGYTRTEYNPSYDLTYKEEYSYYNDNYSGKEMLEVRFFLFNGNSIISDKVVRYSNDYGYGMPLGKNRMLNLKNYDIDNAANYFINNAIGNFR